MAIRVVRPQFENVPGELQSFAQWVLWRYEQRGGKLTKVPCQPDGTRASVTDPQTWAPFDYVQTAYETSKEQIINGRVCTFHGVGFVLTATDPFVGFDFDHCLDEHFNVSDPRVANYVARLNSYTEITPSGTGLRVIVRAKLPPIGRKNGPFECYDDKRFVTITGTIFPG